MVKCNGLNKKNSMAKFCLPPNIPEKGFLFMLYNIFYIFLLLANLVSFINYFSETLIINFSLRHTKLEKGNDNSLVFFTLVDPYNPIYAVMHPGV